MSLEFEYSLGYRVSKDSVAFYDETTVMFAAGKLCILFDLNSGHQRCFQLAERVELCSIVRRHNHVLAAIRGSPACVCVLHILSDTNKKLYTGPVSMESQEIMCLSISTNLKFVAAQSGPPDWMLIIWFSNTREICAILFPSGDVGSSVHDISFNAAGNDELVVVGRGVFKLYEYQTETEEESPFVQHVFEKFEHSGVFHVICWPQKDNLAVGTSTGRILFFRGIDIIYEMSIIDDVAHLQQFNDFDGEQTGSYKGVTSMLVTPELLICIVSGIVVSVYQGEEITSYKICKYIFLAPENPTLKTPGELKSNMDFLKNIILSPDGKDLVGTTHEGQLLRCCGFMDGEERQQFNSLLKRQHNEPVIDVDIAEGRPLIASCSKHTAILWNYNKKEQEMRKVFRNEISSIALHTSGLYMALSFDHFCRTFSILYGGLRERHIFSSKNCSRVRFSSAGHLLAIVSGSVIELYSFDSSSLVFKLDGHAGPVTCIEWKDHDSKLLSCDNHGVICEWNLVSPGKMWENTAVVSYISVSANSVTGEAIAVGSDKSVRCLNDALLQWDFETKKESTCVVLSSNTNLLYTGTPDGCLFSYYFPSYQENDTVYAHSGKVLAINLNCTHDILVSAAADNFIFIWRIADAIKQTSGMFSELYLVNNIQLYEEQNRSKQISMSMQYVSHIGEGDLELNTVKHEKSLRTMAVNHEQTIDDLNEKIAGIKEKMQLCIFDMDPGTAVKEMDIIVRQEIINSAVKLHDTYKRSSTYDKKTKDINLLYDNTIESLSKEHTDFSSTGRNTVSEISEKVNDLEGRLASEEQEVWSKQELLESGEFKDKIHREVCSRAENLDNSHKVTLDDKNFKSAQQKAEIEKLKQWTTFRMKDTADRRNFTSGQIDYDIQDKINSVTILTADFQKLEKSMKAKEKLVQIQEKKFYQMRQLASDLQKGFSVSKTGLNELMEEINSKDLKIESCQREIKAVAESIPILVDGLQVIEDLCATVKEKEGETVEGFQEKQKPLRDTHEIISKYTSMLHLCLNKDYDLMKLVREITCLFEDSKSEFIDETAHSSLQEEYDFQIEKLKKSYDLIKNEPARKMRDKTMAELRLSQENSKILREVHDIQKEAEKLRNVLNGMEAALLLQIASQARGGKVAEGDSRRKIEFVIDSRKKNRESKMCMIEKLDKFIEEQQKEIERFQAMLAAKEGKA